MNTKSLFIIAVIGLLTGIVSVIVYNQTIKVQPPLTVSYNPYKAGIFAVGIIESYQPSGSNVNIFSEVSSRITDIMVVNGQKVKKGQPLMALEDSIQRGIVERDLANIQNAQASLVNVQMQHEKLHTSYHINKKSVARNDLDNAWNSVQIGHKSVAVAQKQYESDKALLDKYVIYSPIDGIVLRIVPTVGDYSTAGVGSYDPTTQAFLPPIQLGIETQYLQVRAYVDEILTPRLPNPEKMEAMMFIRGLQNRGIDLEFSQMQPYTIPNIELSDQRQERVDVRVLPIIFRFEKPTDINIFPGQMVDIYIKETS